MSFTDQKPFVVTQAKKKAFTRYDKRFNCRLCGRHFMEGDCNGDDVLERAAESFNLAVKLAKQWEQFIVCKHWCNGSTGPL